MDMEISNDYEPPVTILHCLFFKIKTHVLSDKAYGWAIS